MKANKTTTQLPPIPNKRYFTIGEVSELCAVKPHVLRYWEQEFAVLKPMKRRGSRRYYQPKDIHLVRNIRELLYEKGFTINGARQQLKGGAKAPAQVLVKTAVAEDVPVELQKPAASTNAQQTMQFDDSLLPAMVKELETLLQHLKSE